MIYAAFTFEVTTLCWDVNVYIVVVTVVVTVRNPHVLPRVRPGHPSSPLVHLSPFYFSLSFIGFTYFLLLSIPSLSTRIVPLHFHVGGRRRRPNLGLVCFFFVFYLCYLYSLDKVAGVISWMLLYRQTFCFIISVRRATAAYQSRRRKKVSSLLNVPRNV